MQVSRVVPFGFFTLRNPDNCVDFEGALIEQKEVALLPLPKVSLTASDYPRLERIARAAWNGGNMDALLLVGEINRAEIVSDEVGEADSLVRIGSWVTYRTNWDASRRSVQLVWPEDQSYGRDCISVLSALGATLIGLRRGDRMPHIGAGSRDFILIENVERSRSNVVPLFRAPTSAKAGASDDDPGPTAA
ncbi:GreA/GreB family elongation factor [Bradyrhizobium sp. ISRA435]|nr:GreA/GreB family elongation factor [Bradyrhizobium sp. ISRA435]